MLVTTYEMVKNQHARHTLVRLCHWNYLVIDEAHVCKNEISQFSQTVRKMHFGNTLLLTGTPLQNNLRELWAILNFMLPDVFDDDSGDIFDSAFQWQEAKTIDPVILEKAYHLLKPFLLRRLKVDVETTLPPRIETKVYCPLSEMQMFWYRLILLKDADLVSKLDAKENGGGEGEGKKATGADWRRLQMMLMQLRKAANHPFLFPGAEGETEATLEELIEASGKLQTLDRLLNKLKGKGHRVVIFSQFTHTLDLIDDYCRGRGHRYTRLDGSTNRIRRVINIDTYNAPESPLFVFLMTTRAGGLGVNLQTADTVILFDSDWNPQPDLQAMARVHRIGQKKVVHVYRLVTHGTIEERVLEHQDRKLLLAQHVSRDAVAGREAAAAAAATAAAGCDGLFGAEDGNEVPEDEDTKKGILAHLTFGSDAVALMEGNKVLDDESLEAIIDRTRTGNECLATGTLKSDKKDAATFDPCKQLTDTRELQGVRYDLPTRKIASLGDINAEWAAVNEKRKQVKRIKMVEGMGTGYGAKAVPILASNEYDLLGGESSVFQRELKGRGTVDSFKDHKKFMLAAFRDYQHEDYCTCCWDGGMLVCCDVCPAAYHLKCLGITEKDLPGKGKWSCPQHRCIECDRNAPAAGGVIFRCQSCPGSYCYDHRPDDMEILGAHARFESLGYPANQHTCFVNCSRECAEFAEGYIKSLPPPDAAMYAMEEDEE